MKKYFTGLHILIILFSFRLSAQTYPVVSTTQIIPPYSVYLSDYASASSDKLIANLFLQDQNQNGLQVKLKITILGENGVKLETKPEFMPPPITLYSGVPEPVSGTALQAYLEPANLNITGLNLQEFMQSKKLPEGIYQFTVEAVEYRRNKLVSNPGTAVAWLILNDPPLWNLPRHNAVVTAGNPQNVFFSWFPMHKGSPNSAFTVEYEFSLYDLIPQNSNPDNFVNTAVPVFQSTTMNTVLSYGPVDPPLEPGRKYACRLRAYDNESRDLFRNNGYSTVLVFTYGQECITPVGIYHDNLTPHTADIHWNAVPGNTEFIVYYREKDENGTNPWYEASTTQRDITIPQLKPLQTYQYTLKGVCGTLESEPAEIYEFTTTQKTVDTLSCNGSGDVPVIDGSPPLDELLLGDVINVGGFEGIITQARGGNGVFTGKCIMRLSNFNILLKSHFTDIHINQSYQVTQGNVIADRGPGIMINLDEIITELDSLANLTFDSILNNPDGYLEDLEIVYDLDPVLVTDSLAEDLEEIQSDLEELAETDGLTEEQLDEIEELLEQIENLLNGDNQSGDNRSFVMFKPFHGQYYGFDEPDTIASLQQYYLPPNQIAGKNQLIRWKSMKVNGYPDKVIARLDSVNPNIKFYNSAGTELMVENGPADTLKIVTIPSPTMVSDDIITAVWQENDTVKHVVGMLNVKAYEQKNLNIVVVPVNGNVMPMTIDQLRDSLNKTFGEAAINMDVVEYEGNFRFNYKQADGDEHFNAWPDSNEVATSDMLALQEAFVQTGNYDENTYYLFLVRNSSHWELLGLMPFFQNFGYIFTDGVTVEQCTHTSLHELGHGAFGLVHPFDEHAGIDENNYDNLMTYHYSSTRLLKYQWDLIQYPVCWIGVNCYGARNAGMIKINEIYLNNFARVIKTINCAINNNERYVTIYNDFTELRVKFGDILQRLLNYKYGNYIDDIELTLFVSDNSIKISSYYEDTYDLNNVYFNDNTKRITIHGLNHHDIVIGPVIENEAIYAYLKQLFTSNINLCPSTNAANNLSINELEWEPICTYELIDDNRIKALLAAISNSSISKKREKIVFNLIHTIQNATSFYNEVEQYPSFIITLYNSLLSEGRNELMSVVNDLWYNHYNNNLEYIKSLTTKTYILTESIWGNPDNKIEFTDQGKLEFYTTYYEFYPGHEFPIKRNKLILEASLFDPVYCGFENDISNKPLYPVPAIVLKNIADKGNLQNGKDALSSTVNVVLFAVGVGEIIQGVRAGIIVARTSGFFSTEMLLASGRITIGAADLAAFATSEFCNNSNSEFCKDWKEYEFYVNMGLLTTSLADVIITKLRRSYTPSVKAGMTDDQIDFIENKLGIPVSNLDNLASLFPRLANKENALIKLDNILNSGRVPQQKLINAVNGDLGDILTNADNVNLSKILDRLNLEHVSEIHFDKITERLSNYATLKQDLLNHPDWFETFDDILDNPGKYRDILNEGNIPSGTALSSWGQGYWWKNLRDLADEFESVAALNEVEDIFGSVYGTNITLKVTNNSTGKIIEIVPDFLAFKNGKYHIADAKYTTKSNFSVENSFTPNQGDVFSWIKDTNSNITVEVRASNSKLTGFSGALQQGDIITKSDLKIDILKSKQNDNSIVEIVINYH